MRALAFITLFLARTALIAGAGFAVFAEATLAVSVLVTGVVLATPAAIAGAARTLTASSAAEMVFNMIVSLWDRTASGRMAGLVDRGDQCIDTALNPL